MRRTAPPGHGELPAWVGGPRRGARLSALHAEREASVNAHAPLAWCSFQVVDQAFRETKTRLVSMSAVGLQIDRGAYRAGWVAGERVNLSRPVESEGRAPTV
jgi:hypothetical protein